MLTNGSNDYPRSLTHRLFCNDTSHILGIHFIQMTDRFVHNKKIERLAKRPYQRHTLLLSKRKNLSQEINTNAKRLSIRQKPTTLCWRYFKIRKPHPSI